MTFTNPPTKEMTPLEEAREFAAKFQRSYLAYHGLIQAAYGLGDRRDEAYEALSDEAKAIVCDNAVAHILYFRPEAAKALQSSEREAREIFMAGRRAKDGTTVGMDYNEGGGPAFETFEDYWTKRQSKAEKGEKAK